MNNNDFQADETYNSLPSMQSFDESFVESKIASVLSKIYTEVRHFLCQSVITRSSSDNNCHDNLIQVKEWFALNKQYCSKYKNLEWPQALAVNRKGSFLHEIAIYAPASLLIQEANGKMNQVGNVCAADIKDLENYAYEVISNSKVAEVDGFEKAILCFEASQCETWLELKSPVLLFKKVLNVE
ncbi:hypothetical protein [Latilactobacillus sakei]|uniref:hypothetical protein n=1 Tax=Latilactobacillus sakei TaxID=1599 RepID=UPI00202E6BBF|nr:hypothetical protein [Latilactobacillus sakei]MCM1636543.1 hypothetical protein [Latilactobacillus sakei]